MAQYGSASTLYSVIVGDLIDSKTKDVAARAVIFRAAKDTFDRINANYGDGILAEFGLVRGDAFEGVLLARRMAPRIIQEIIKGFYEADGTRLRICMVTSELTTVSTDRNEADGPAFHQALAAIEEMKKSGSRHWLQVSMHTQSAGQPLLEGLLSALTALTETWTDRQRQIVWAMEALSGQRRLVAEQLGINVSSVYKQLKAARYPAYRQAWQSMERYFEDLDPRAGE